MSFQWDGAVIAFGTRTGDIVIASGTIQSTHEGERLSREAEIYEHFSGAGVIQAMVTHKRRNAFTFTGILVHATTEVGAENLNELVNIGDTVTVASSDKDIGASDGLGGTRNYKVRSAAKILDHNQPIRFEIELVHWVGAPAAFYSTQVESA